MAGYDTRGPVRITKTKNPRWVQGDLISMVVEVKRGSVKPRIGYLVNGDWNGWSFEVTGMKEVEGKMEELRLMVCIAHFISISISKYIFGVSSIERHVKKKFGKDFDLSQQLLIG